MSRAQEILKQILEAKPLSQPTIILESEPTDLDTIKIGQHYAIGGWDGPYVLAAVAYKKCALICVTTGNRWNEGMPVEDVNDISPDEWQTIATSAIGKITRLHINGR